jgi:hypothetical protein
VKSIEITTNHSSIWIDVDDGVATLSLDGPGLAELTPEKIDELIRALGTTRVELSKARLRP